MEIVRKPARKPRKPRFPNVARKLSPKAMAVRARILSEWLITDSDLILLDEALSFRDAADRYEEQIEREGLVLANTKTGATRPHPALAALRLARSNFLSAWGMLKLHDETVTRPPGRPPRNYPDREK